MENRGCVPGRMIMVLILTLGMVTSGFCKKRGKKKYTMNYSDDKVSALTFIDTLNLGNEVCLADKKNQTILQENNNKTKGNQSNSGKMPKGYKIQLLASSSVETIRLKKKNAESGLNLHVYILHDKPYYKMYAGNFKDRRSAEKALRRIKENGYPDAWIVKPKVFVDE